MNIEKQITDAAATILLVYEKLQESVALLRGIKAIVPERPALALELLSEKEREVFDLIGQGLKTNEIAVKLGRASKTIANTRDVIRIKLHVGSAKELRQIAQQFRRE